MFETREVSYVEEEKSRLFKAKDGTLREVKLVECPSCKRIIHTSLKKFKCRECWHYYDTDKYLSDLLQSGQF